MRRRNGPVQEWVDSIPSPINTSTPKRLIKQQECISDEPNITATTSTEPKDIPLSTKIYTRPPSMTVSAPINVPNSPPIGPSGIPSSLPYRLVRDPSVQSDSSHCSSVESLLELRRADPEAILLGLGFGGGSNSPQEGGPLSRIPKRFLQPSKLKGIAINDFVKQQQETSESFDSVSLGYRGLTGSPYVAPSEIVQKIMDRLREHESHEGDSGPYNANDKCQSNKLSVLSPDNRQFLEQPRSRSPDMRNKRMIIGQKSFAFGCDGDLIEIESSDGKEQVNNNLISSQDIEDPKAVDIIISPEPNIISENIVNTKIEKRLSKQLSFDETEWSDNEHDSQQSKEQTPEFTSNYQEEICVDTENNTDNGNEMQQSTPTVQKHCNCPNCSTVLSKNNCRSSKINFTRNISLEEQEQPSTKHVTIKSNNQRPILSKLLKRKSLKRQSKIREVDSVYDINNPSENVASVVPSISTQVASSITPSTSEFQCKDTFKNVACASQIDSANHVLEHKDESITAQLDVKYSCNEHNQTCCVRKKEGICEHEKNSKDCCHTDEKCWKKMEKIMQENKKLEDMVAKSRREMAEIRDMLSSVLSVRMEPGF